MTRDITAKEAARLHDALRQFFGIPRRVICQLQRIAMGSSYLSKRNQMAALEEAREYLSQITRS